jgi:hypothetical protein
MTRAPLPPVPAGIIIVLYSVSALVWLFTQNAYAGMFTLMFSIAGGWAVTELLLEKRHPVYYLCVILAPLGGWVFWGAVGSPSHALFVLIPLTVVSLINFAILIVKFAKR